MQRVLIVEDSPTMRALLASALEELDVPLKVEGHGEKQKVFPVSDRATDVLAALLRLLDRSGATLRTGGRLGDIAPTMLAVTGLERPPEMTGVPLLA